MKIPILLTLVCGLIGAAGGPVPRKATYFAVRTDGKNYISLDKYAGKTVVVAFVLTDCSHCEVLTKDLNGIQKDYSARGVRIIESALDPMASAKIPAFQQKVLGTAFPMGVNDTREAAFFLQYKEGEKMQMPVVAIVDKNGMIRAQFDIQEPGFNKDPDKYLRTTLDQVLKTDIPVPEATTRKKTK